MWYNVVPWQGRLELKFCFSSFPLCSFFKSIKITERRLGKYYFLGNNLLKKGIFWYNRLRQIDSNNRMEVL